jgi:hypothetical protein
VLLALLRPRVAGIAGRPLAWSLARIAGASIVLGAVAYGTWWALDEALGDGLAGQVIAVGAALAVGAAAYLGACRVIRVRELDTLLSLRRAHDER